MFCPLRHFLLFLVVLINEMESQKDSFKTGFKVGIYFLKYNQTVVKKSHQGGTEDTGKYVALLSVLVSEMAGVVTASRPFLQKQTPCYPVGFPPCICFFGAHQTEFKNTVTIRMAGVAGRRRTHHLSGSFFNDTSTYSYFSKIHITVSFGFCREPTT